MEGGLNPQILAAIIFIGMLAVVGLGIMVLTTLAGPNRKASQRVDRLKMRWAGNVAAASAISVRRKGSSTNLSGVARFFKIIVPRPYEMRRRLDKTGRSISLNQYVMANVFTGLIVGILFWLFVDVPSIVTILVAITAGLGLPFMITGRMIKKRDVKFLKLFPDGIDLIVRGLRSGLPISECLRTVCEEVGDPVGTEFKRIVEATQLGRPQDEVLKEAGQRLDIQDFHFFVTTLEIQRETGGNLAETLDKLSDILRKRQQMKLKIRAMSSEARASAIIIGSLPFVMVLVLMALNFDYVSTLWTDPRGVIMSLAGLVFIGMGSLMISKMVNFEI